MKSKRSLSVPECFTSLNPFLNAGIKCFTMTTRRVFPLQDLWILHVWLQPKQVLSYLRCQMKRGSRSQFQVRERTRWKLAIFHPNSKEEHQRYQSELVREGSRCT